MKPSDWNLKDLADIYSINCRIFNVINFNALSPFRFQFNRKKNESMSLRAVYMAANQGSFSIKCSASFSSIQI